MGGYEFVVAGAGPAGAAAAAVLARRGYRVVVLESAARPGVKPCGYGIPDVEGLPVRVPRDTVLVRIRGARLYVDGVLATEMRGRLQGFIVDKPAFLEAVIAESGAEVVYRSRYDPARGFARLQGKPVDVRVPVILAGGWGYYDGETIAAVQVEASLSRADEDMLEIYFDTGLLGYYWVFPRGGGVVDVGVGGFAGFDELRTLLGRFVERLGAHPRGPIRGARIAVGGLRLRRLRGAVLAGEAAGFVLPLTGEGIRPSMASGAVAAEALAEGRDPVKAQEDTWAARAVRVQRRVLEKVKAMGRAERARLLMELPPEVHEEVALGTLRKARIAAALASKPRVLARLLRVLALG